MITDEIQKYLADALRKVGDESGKEVKLEPLGSFIELPPHDIADYSISAAFALGKLFQQNPAEIAEKLSAKLKETDLNKIAEIKTMGGYINIFLKGDFLRKELSEIHKKRNSFGGAGIGGDRTVIVEYSQPNIAKIMHIGHLRTTVLGDALANILEELGYKVVRWNYIGDWGTQFGKLIAAYKLWGDKKEVEKKPIQTLLALYVRFHKELKDNPELDSRGQEEFKKLEEGDKENKKLWEWFRKESLKEFEKTYKLLGIKFDVMTGEAFFEKDLKPLVSGLLEKGIAEKGEEGAIIIKLDNLPPALIQKADGASLYLTRDIAALKCRLSKYRPKKILYVVGNEQSLHFDQLFAVSKMLGLDEAELMHVKYGLVLGEDGKKMATREGEAVPLEEVITKAVGLAREVVEKKNPALSEKDKANIAKVVALGALKYEMLKENRNSDIVFNWQRMLDFSGNSAPYLQYTYARFSSILKKAGKIGSTDLGQLTNGSELGIIKHLLDFPKAIADSGRTSQTNNLALYLYDLANLANRFYESVPILKDENTDRRNSHLVLIETAITVIKNGLKLLGIQVLEKI